MEGNRRHGTTNVYQKSCKYYGMYNNYYDIIIVLCYQEYRLPTINAIAVPDDLSDPYRVNAFADR